MASGVAQRPIRDIKAYRQRLQKSGVINKEE
jgi:hypothetical protein